jgi:hypothetical protein
MNEYSKTLNDGWKYDEGTDEAALYNNIEHPEHETIGKIYYIHKKDSSTIIPFRVMAINDDGTIDLSIDIARREFCPVE